MTRDEWKKRRQEVEGEGRENLTVYFIRQMPKGPIKIGIARSVQERLGQLQVGNPQELKIIGVMRGGRPVERELHERFAHLHIGGEWYRPMNDLQCFIRKNAEHYSRRTHDIPLVPKYTDEEIHRMANSIYVPPILRNREEEGPETASCQGGK